MAEAFDQHAAVALGLGDPFIHFIEPAVYPLESPVDLLEPPVQAMNKPMKAFIEVLDKLLIHTASAAV